MLLFDIDITYRGSVKALLPFDVINTSGHSTRSFYTRAETNIRLVRMFARLHKYSNTSRVFGYAVNDISA